MLQIPDCVLYPVFNFPSFSLYFWLYITHLLTQCHIFLLTLVQSRATAETMKQGNVAPSIKRQNYRIKRTLQGICSILEDTFIFKQCILGLVSVDKLYDQASYGFTLTNRKVTGNVSKLLINTESDRVVYYFGKLLRISNG